MNASATPAVAVIGLGARFPAAPDLAAFWRLLDDGRDAVTVVPPDRWSADDLYDPTAGRRGKMNTRWGAFLDDLRGFDAAFFGISPREARDMDPQQRLLLEVAWATFESAGYAPDRLGGSATGVFIGMGASDFQQIQFGRRDHRETITAYSGTGQAHSIGPNRLSYAFDLRGPSMAIDTACSSSLVAIHQAVRSLASGESTMALAGGVSIVLAPEVSIAFSHAQMLAADGRCKSFDARADGYVRGEGCGLVLLKPLDAALRDGDPIFGVVAGSAVNQDGRSNGLTAPNGRAQADVVRRALEAAGVAPARIGYVEAHGTGTPLGDPIELNALATALEAPDRVTPTLVGSVKTNIGHLECASGIAGFLKALLALEHERIPANLHFEQLNPAITLGATLRIAASSTPWLKSETPRYAGVSSYGFGGANAHVVLREAPQAAPPAVDARGWHVVTLSAKTESALARSAELLRDALPSNRSLADLAHTSSAGRAHFGHRLAVVVKSIGDLSDELDAVIDGAPSARVQLRHQTDFGRPRIGFLFTGQGAQYVGMGRELYATCGDFQAAFDRCAQVLDPLLDEPLATLFDGSGAPGALDRTGNTQPALFALEYALAMTWIAWGVVPHALLGHSVGEFAAAVIGGILTLEDAALLVARRARLMQTLPGGGAMAAIAEPASAVASRLEGYESQASIAALNGPAATVISGSASAVDAVVRRAQADGVGAAVLNVSHAFHSPLMDPMLAAFEAGAERIPARVPHTITISNVTGRPHATAPDAAYWRRHVREPVAFMAGVEALAAAGCDVLLEIGPDATLIGMVKKIEAAAACAIVPSLRRGRDAWRTLGEASAALYARNAPLDWRAVYRGERREIVPLPNYPFEHRPHWYENATGSPLAVAAGAPLTPTGHPLLGERIMAAAPLFWATISLDELPYLRDHQIEGRVMLPASAFVEVALAAGEICQPGGRHEVSNIMLRRPLIFDAGEPHDVQTSLRATAGGAFEVEIHARRGERWTLLATATLGQHVGDFAGQADPGPASRRGDGAELYASLRSVGYGYGPAFAAVRTIERSGNVAAGTIVMPIDLRESERTYRFHPALLDACFHVAAATTVEAQGLFVPASIESIRMHGVPSRELRVIARQRSESDASGIVVDLTIENCDGGPVASVAGLRAQRLAREKADTLPSATAPPIYDLAWTKWAPEAAGAPGRCSVIGEGPRARRFADGLRGLGWTVTRAERETGVASQVLGAAGDAIIFASGLDRADDALAFDLLPVARRALEAHAAQLVVVTAGAQKVGSDDLVMPGASGLWGAARTIAREHPELGLKLLDLPAAPRNGAAHHPDTPLANESAHSNGTGHRNDVDALVAAVVSGACGPEEFAVRAGELWRASLVARPPAQLSAPSKVPNGPYLLRSTQRGRLDGLRTGPATRPRAAAGQIVVEVAAAGLNFRDVMKTLGMYPSTRPDGDWLGDECAGTVIQLGEGVSRFAVGDPVVAFAPAAFGRFATTLATLAAPIPRELDFAAAAAVPVAYGTSWYALKELAQLRPGQRVLIHAAAGGVGLAAVAVAKHLGAEIYATAGSDEKRALLRSLGVDAVFDSRSLDFVNGIRERTGGAGVDVVLNSLAGDALTATLSIVAPFGRFVEIGKKDIYANSPLPMRPLARNVSFFALDMDELLGQRPEVGGALLSTLLPLVADGTLAPLPVTSFAVNAAERAFRMMAQARHIGKIVLTFPAAARGGCAIVSGGFGGLGAPVVGWLQERGFATIVLTGRNDPSPAAREAIERVREAGTTVVCERMDVADESSVAQTCQRVRATYGPITGVVHLAGSLDDGVMLHQTSLRFNAVAAPKVHGVRNLHEQTRADALELFVVFSSAAAVLGSPGQSAYAAANAYLEGFVHERRRAGMPGLCAHFGPWAEVGMAARTRRRSAGGAVRSLQSAAALSALSQTLDDGSEAVTIIDADWSLWRQFVPDGDAYPLVRNLLPAPEPAIVGEASAVAKLHLATVAPAERRAWLAAFIAGEVAAVMETDRATLAHDQPIGDLGIDSLMGLELQLRLEQELNVAIPRMVLMQSPTIADFANIIADALEIDRIDAPVLHAAPVSRERLRLICFPHAGAGADPYRALARELRDDVEIVALEYPGHGSRMAQPLRASMAELVAAITADLAGKLNARFAFLGHSLGALVAFACARELAVRGGPGPVALFVSSAAGPWADRRTTLMSGLDDAAFIERLRAYNGTPAPVLDDVDLMRAFLPMVRSDFAIAEHYRPERDARVAMPIVAVGGESDPHIDAAALASWADATTSTFELVMVPGDHFHITAPGALAAAIRRTVSLAPV
jgi:acyl transferase domain-containing protein/surfactin synthase thioesterase subunit/acyl carrier protein